MKKAILLLLFVLIYTNSQAQKDFQGMAVYESKTSMADFKVRMEGNKNINPEMQKMMEERMKKMFEKVGYEKWSGRKIYHWLKFEMNFRSATSNKLALLARFE